MAPIEPHLAPSLHFGVGVGGRELQKLSEAVFSVASLGVGWEWRDQAKTSSEPFAAVCPLVSHCCGINVTECQRLACILGKLGDIFKRITLTGPAGVP